MRIGAREHTGRCMGATASQAETREFKQVHRYHGDEMGGVTGRHYREYAGEKAGQQK